MLNFSFKFSTFYLASISFTWLKFTCVNVRSQKRISGNQPLYFFFAFTVWQIIIFIYTALYSWPTLIQFVNCPSILLSIFFFLSRWVLERVELEAGPEHPRIKIVPEDWFLWISKNEDDGGNLNGILWFFSWWRKHFLNTGIYSYLLCNSIQHFVYKRCCTGHPLFGYLKVKDNCMHQR